MPGRSGDRIAATLQVEFRTASALLVAYSINVSRGGMFLETDVELPIGAPVTLALEIPGEPAIALPATVAWRRGRDSPDGPHGLGVQFEAVSLALGAAIDRLVASFQGLTLLLVPGGRTDAATLQRLARAVFARGELLIAADVIAAGRMLSARIDLLVIDLDDSFDAALALVRDASSVIPPVPVVALAYAEAARQAARQAGAVEACTTPIGFADLQGALLRAVGRPVAVT